MLIQAIRSGAGWLRSDWGRFAWSCVAACHRVAGIEALKDRDALSSRPHQAEKTAGNREAAPDRLNWHVPAPLRHESAKFDS